MSVSFKLIDHFFRISFGTKLPSKVTEEKFHDMAEKLLDDFNLLPRRWLGAGGRNRHLNHPHPHFWP